MTNEITTLQFNSDQFGQLRVVKDDNGEPWFVARDVCNALGLDHIPTQRAMEMGLSRIKETAVTHSDGHVTINRTPKVTGKGQLYFMDKFKGEMAAANGSN